MMKEVAFVAIAVSDHARARKFYEKTLELVPGPTASEGAWSGIRSRRHDDRGWLSSCLATFARWNNGRV